MRRCLVVVTVALAALHLGWRDAASTPTPAPGDGLSQRLERTEIQRAASSIPGRDIVQVRTKIPVGVASGWHTHPGEEVGYIIAGRIEMEVTGRPTLHLRAGQGFLIPPGTPHNAHDLGPETGVMLSTYVVERGRPLATLVAVENGNATTRPGAAAGAP
jgi:quercetin dioxygenase-like cupin family protein